ncbi:MAG TPA: nitroreductase family protein [Anaerolineales bacterium]
MTAIGLPELQVLLRSRRSVRRFRPDPIDPALIRGLLEAARWAPSPHNRQPWRFVVLQEADNRQRLAQAMGERLRAERLADGADPQAVQADVSRSYDRITGAPLAVLLCMTLEQMDRYPDARRSRAERRMAVQGVAMAGQNLLLAAHAAGLGACWICAPLFAPEVVRQVLELPEDWDPQGLVVLGWPAESPPERERTPLEQVTLYHGG